MTALSQARDLCRSASFTPATADDDENDGRTLIGYGATFGDPTEINSWEGSFTETIRKGAFRKSLRERTPVLQFDHGHHPLIGSIPIGQILDIREDDHGLYVEARISDNWLMQPIRDAIAEGTVSGMSFRFEVIREEWRDNAGKKITDPEEVYRLLYMPGDRGPLQRELVEVKMREVGPVVFPAYESTTVGVRARSVADEFTSSPDLAAKVRQALALDARGGEGDLDNPDFRKEVATALLFERMAPVVSDHPSVESPAAGTASDGAPAVETTPAPEAPASEHTDAPSVEGHPSPDSTTVRMKSNLREVIALMRDVTESFNTQENPS